jgi:TP901 family phage tail tape measure protein
MGDATENRKINIYLNGKQVENNMKSIRKEYFKANAQLNKMTRGTEKYINKSNEIKRIKGLIDDHNKGLFGASKAWQQLKGVMIGVLGANLIQGGFQKLIGFIPDLINRVAGLSDVMADVRKTSGLTGVEVRELNLEFRKFDTRTPRKELLALAVEGGRLGKKTVKDLSDFVEVADKIKVALGDDLGGNGGEAIRMVGKLTEQYQVGNQYQVQFGESMLKMGSAINEVSASGSNQASYLIDYMRRLSGVSNQADISAASTIGYAAALDEAGQAVEVSGTTMSKVMVNMFKDTATYAEIAGMKTKEFKELLGKDSNEAMLKFLEGLNGNNEGLGVMAKKMDKLGLDGARAITVLSALAANTDKVREKQELANTAMEEGTSLTNEFNIKNENVAGQWEKIGKAFSKIFTSGPIMDGVENLVGWMYDMIKIPLSDTLEKERVSMRGLELQIYDVNTPAKKRIELIKELKGEYPQLLKFIDAENVSNEGLEKALQNVNESLIHKILIQRKQEEINKAAELVADAVEEQLSKEIAHRELLAKIAEEHGITIGKNLTLTEQTADVQLQLKEEFKGQDFGKYDLNNLRSSYSELVRLTRVAEGTTSTLNKLAQSKSEFEKSISNKTSDLAITNKAFLKAHGIDGEKEEEIVVTSDELSEKEKSNLQKKWAAFNKAQIAMKKKFSMGVDQEGEIEEVNFTDATEQVTDIFGDDKEFENQMAKLSEQEERKANLILEMDAATQDNKHQTAAEKQLEYYEILKLQAEQNGLDVSALNVAIAETDAEVRIEKLQAQAKEFETFYNALKEIAGAYYAWQAAKDEAKLAGSQSRTDAQIADVQRQVEGDVLSQEQADEKIAEIKEKGRVRDAKIKREAWVKERDAKLIMVAIETALAVIKAAPNPLLMAAAGITGGLSMATIKSKPIPQFAFGTDNAPGGVSLVGEFGPELKHIPAGAQITSATETADILSDANNPQLSLGAGGALGGNSEILQELKLLRQEFASLPHMVRGDWRLDDLDAVKEKKRRSESAAAL